MENAKMFLVKYAEIGTKGKNRYVFEETLCKRIRNKIKSLGEFDVRRDFGRIYVEALSDFDYDTCVEYITKVFGVNGICPVTMSESTDYDEISKAALQHMTNAYDDFDFSFKVHCRRTNKSYPMTSVEVEAEVGHDLLVALEEKGLHVNVHNPDVMLEIEIRDKVYVYSKVLPGPGGLPVGTNGKAVSLLSGGIDSPVATYMIAKRGVEMQAVYFNSPPYTSARALEKLEKLGTIVSEYSGPIALHIVNFTELQLAIYDNCPHDELTIIMKRYMFRMAKDIALKEGAQCIVTGESIGQVSSQTMQSLGVIDEAVDIPVYRPVIGMDKQEIVEYSQRIGTYETSIEPYEDCCTIFVAKHPVTKPKLDVIKRHEKKLEGIIEPIYQKALDTVEIKVLR